MQLIYPKEDGNAYMFIIESKKNKKTDLKIIKPLVVHNNGRYTDEVLKIFNFKKTC